MKGILYIHDTDAFFIPGRGGVDLGHVKAGGAIQAIVAEVKERGFSDTGLFAGGDVFPGQAHLRIGAGLDLHEAENALIPGDQVDLAEAAADGAFELFGNDEADALDGIFWLAIDNLLRSER